MVSSKKQNRPTSRRTQIKLAALACFLDRGYVATTIADIRARSGATTGSIYHFFDGKGALAFELFAEAVADWSDETELARRGDSPAELIHAAVLGLMRWGLAEPEQFRFLDEVRALAPTLPELAPCADMLASGQVDARTVYLKLAGQGAVRNLDWPVAHALMLGPAYDYLRARAGENTDRALQRQHADILAVAAWDAVRIGLSEAPQP